MTLDESGSMGLLPSHVPQPTMEAGCTLGKEAFAGTAGQPEVPGALGATLAVPAAPEVKKAVLA